MQIAFSLSLSLLSTLPQTPFYVFTFCTFSRSIDRLMKEEWNECRDFHGHWTPEVLTKQQHAELLNNFFRIHSSSPHRINSYAFRCLRITVQFNDSWNAIIFPRWNEKYFICIQRKQQPDTSTSPLPIQLHWFVCCYFVVSLATTAGEDTEKRILFPIHSVANRLWSSLR